MLRLQLFSALILVHILSSVSLGECVHVILGDPVTFPVTGNCGIGEPAALYRVRQHGAIQLVARLEQGVCKPSEAYNDRMNQSLCFLSSRYTDTGLYQLNCGSREENVQLDVVVGFEVSVKEGKPVKLPCYYSTTGKHVEAVRWWKKEDLVLERDLSSELTKYGTGFERRVSLSHDGHSVGDWSLIWDRAELEDEGDYFCSVHRNGAREGWGNPAAVRLKVSKRNPEQTTLCPTLTRTQTITEERMGTLAVVFTTVFVTLAIALLFLLPWLVKTRCANGPCGCRGQFQPVVQNGQLSQANGVETQMTSHPEVP